MWRDFTCLEWADWSMFWVGVSATVLFFTVCWFGLVFVLFYYDHANISVKREQGSKDQWIEETGRRAED